jgi:hypothetical protein
VATTSETGLQPEHAEFALELDPRWLLIQRIVESRSFERATQLRKILLYVAKSAIMQPERVLREYDIAYDVLDRRKDFDPANDNIVRSQFTNLRRKLEGYFLEEGSAETLIVKIPKGSYLPVFSPVRATAPVPQIPGWMLSAYPGELAAVSAMTSAPQQKRQNTKELVLLGMCLVLAGGLVWMGLRAHYAAKPGSIQTGNAFVQFLGRTEGKVTVVVPDIALVQIEEARGGEDVSIGDYVRSDYPQRQIAQINDPALRSYLTHWSGMRMTTFNEGMIASNFIETLQQLGVSAEGRYARDLRVSDLNGDNVVLIGSAASNPWVGLFENSLNFRFVEDRQNNEYYFENLHPAAGEPSRYTVQYPNPDNTGRALGYADIVLTQNEMHTGYVLMFVASDEQEVESAAKFLLNGKLPSEVVSILNRKDVTSFEFFLRGRHLAGQADNAFELVAVRSH